MFHVEHWLFFLSGLSGRARWLRGVNRGCGKAKFSFACQKRTRNGSRAGSAGIERGYAGLSSLLRAKREPEKHPLLSRRGRHEKGAARPFQTPKERSKRKKASRCAKRFFLVSPICCFAAGVTFSQGVKFSNDVKSSAEP